MRISPVTAQLFNVDGQADMTKLRVTFQSFVNVPKNDIQVAQLRHVK
jgi:hypothetical protein